MKYFLVTGAFFLLMLLYFKIANRYNIIDTPKERSSHDEITVRGGGIIFPIAYLFFMGYEFFFKNYGFKDLISSNYWIFGLGFLLICGISFIDDLLDLSSKIRLLFHFISVTLLLYFTNAFQVIPIWSIPLCYFLIIGILNAYNFMDGINGLSGIYSILILCSLLYVNGYLEKFTDQNFIIFPILASGVFLFFNFRKKAKCFLGDIGSMGIAFWIMSLLVLLMLETGQVKWILLLTVYGTDTILTLIERLKLKENIFEGHRRHLYQLLVNEKKQSHLIISLAYGLLQLIINVFIILSNWPEWVIFCVVLFPTALFYDLLKSNVKKNISIC